jgi:hypothetical protein
MVAAPSPFLSLPAGPHLRLATRSGSVLLLSLPAGSTVSSVPPDSHLSLSLSLSAFSLLACRPTPLHARAELRLRAAAAPRTMCPLRSIARPDLSLLPFLSVSV